MAADLVARRAFGSGPTAIRTLPGLGYGYGQIVKLVDQARARAAEIAGGAS